MYFMILQYDAHDGEMWSKIMSPWVNLYYKNIKGIIVNRRGVSSMTDSWNYVYNAG